MATELHVYPLEEGGGGGGGGGEDGCGGTGWY